MEVIGKITKKLEKMSGTSQSGKDWEKQSIVIERQKEYKNIICVDFFGEEKVKFLEVFNIGDKVKISLDVFSREYQGKYFTNVEGWKIQKVASESEIQKDTEVVVDTISEKPKVEEEDDLPF